MGRLDGQVAVITGGASGIGEASARLFVQEGARVVIADIQDERGKRLAAELDGHATFQHTDVNSEAQIKAAIDRALSDFGRLDCMFNNAGAPAAVGNIDELSAEAFDSAVAVLLRSVFLGMKLSAPILKRQGSGTMINMASVAGFRTGYSGHLYSTCKAAVIHLTRSVAMELRDAGVRVNSVCPGFVSTPMFARVFELPPEADEATVAAMARGTRTLGRPADAEDVANAALWLASDESHYVNGHNLVIDNADSGGRTWSDLRRTALEVSASIRQQMRGS